MAWNKNKFVPGALRWGSVAAKVPGVGQNPYAIAGAGLAGGFLESLSGKPDDYNKQAYHDALMKYEKGAFDRTRRVSRELGSQGGAQLAARGVNDTALAQFMMQNNKTNLYSKTLDQVNQVSADLEMQLAHADNQIALSQNMDERRSWIDARDTIYALLTDKLKDDPPNETGELTDNERRERNEGNQKGTTFTNQPPTTKPNIPGAAPRIPGVMQEKATNSSFAFPKGNPVKPHRPSMLLSNPFSPDQTKPTVKINSKYPKMTAIREQIGDINADYLAIYLGEDFSDIFEWEQTA